MTMTETVTVSPRQARHKLNLTMTTKCVKYDEIQGKIKSLKSKLFIYNQIFLNEMKYKYIRCEVSEPYLNTVTNRAPKYMQQFAHFKR